MVTGVRKPPEVGPRKLMTGGEIVKRKPLLGTPPTVTTTLPLVVPLGTRTVTLVLLQLDGAAVVPLNVTVLVP